MAAAVALEAVDLARLALLDHGLGLGDGATDGGGLGLHELLVLAVESGLLVLEFADASSLGLDAVVDLPLLAPSKDFGRLGAEVGLRLALQTHGHREFSLSWRA